MEQFADTVFYSGPGVGDNLMLTAVAHNFYNLQNKRLPIHTSYPEIFINNPYVDVRSIGKGYWDLPVAKKNKYRQCGYCGIRHTGDGFYCDYLLPQNMILSMCRDFICVGNFLVTPEMFLTQAEKESGKLFGEKQIVLNYRGKEHYKTWDFNKACLLTDYLQKRGFVVLQTGLKDDPLIPQATDLRGRLNLRELAAVLASSRMYIGPFGGVTHLARAVACPGVILFPGAENPAAIHYGYTLLTEKNGCTRCRDEKMDPFCGCFLDANCTFNISLDQVISAVENELSHPRSDLPPAYAQIDDVFLSEQMIGIGDYVKTQSDVANIRLKSERKNLQQSTRLFANLKLNAHFRFYDKLISDDWEISFQDGFLYRLFSYSEYDKNRKLISSHNFPDDLQVFLKNGCACRCDGCWQLIPQFGEIILKYPKQMDELCCGISISCMAIPLKTKKCFLPSEYDFDCVSFFRNRVLVKWICFSLREFLKRLFLFPRSVFCTILTKAGNFWRN